MIESGTSRAFPDFARALAGEIERQAEILDDRLRDTAAEPSPQAEATAFDRFESVLSLALERYQRAPSTSRGVGKLVFQPLYDNARAAATSGPRALGRADHVPHRARAAVLAALLAAHVEAQGQLRLNSTQIHRLVAVLIGLGETLERMRLPVHAEAAYQQAYRLQLETADYPAIAECLRLLTSVRQRARFRTSRGLAAARWALNAGLAGLVGLLGALAYAVEVRLSHDSSPGRTWLPAVLVVAAAGLAVQGDLTSPGRSGLWAFLRRPRREWLVVAAVVLLAIASAVTAANATDAFRAAADRNHVVEPSGATEVVVAVGGLISAVGLAVSAVIKSMSLLLHAKADLTRARLGIEAPKADDSDGD